MTQKHSWAPAAALRQGKEPEGAADSTAAAEGSHRQTGTDSTTSGSLAATGDRDPATAHAPLPPPISSALRRGAGSKLPAAFLIGSYSRGARGLAAVEEGGRCPLTGRPLGKAAGEPLARWRAGASGLGPEEGAIGWKVG